MDELAVAVAYSNQPVAPDIKEMAFDLVDGGYFEDKVLSGRCSLQATLDLDMVAWEARMDKDIAILKGVMIIKRKVILNRSTLC